MTKKGTKRKRAPPKGPCEHGVKYRSQCKVCSACPHGKWRSLQGVRWVSICEHGRVRLSARSAVGVESASTVVSGLSARSVVGLSIRARSSAL